MEARVARIGQPAILYTPVFIHCKEHLHFHRLIIHPDRLYFRRHHFRFTADEHRWPVYKSQQGIRSVDHFELCLHQGIDGNIVYQLPGSVIVFLLYAAFLIKECPGTGANAIFVTPCDSNSPLSSKKRQVPVRLSSK